MLIRDVLAGKERQDVVTVSPDATVRELVAKLAEHNVGALIVSGDGTSMDGIVSERDVVRHLHADGTVVNQRVGDIMTSVVRTCDTSDTVDGLMAAMTEHRIRHVPVLADGELVGIISIGDVVKHRIDELEFERDQLDQYVHQT